MRMSKYKQGFTLTLLVALLAACGGDGGSSGGGSGGNDQGDQGEAWTPIEPEAPVAGNPDAIPYASYPIASMKEVPITASFMIKYNDSVHEQYEILNNIGLVKDLGSESQQTIPTEVTLADRGRTVIITPNQNLDPFTTYNLQRPFSPNENPGDYFYPSYYYSFTTGGDPDGTAEQQSYDAEEMAREFISPTVPSIAPAIRQEKRLSWSVYRFVHTQPVDPETVHYGEGEGSNLRMTNEDTGDLIDANVFVDARTIVIDPVEDLDVEPGHPVTYDGDEDSGIKSVFGMLHTPLPDSVYPIYANNTTQPGWEATIEGVDYSLPAEIDAEFADPKQNSVWTDQWLNQLAGNPDADLDVDLVTVPGGFFSTTGYHFRIRKESLSGGAVEPIARALGGDRGDIEVTFPTDLTGYVVMTNGVILSRLYVYMNLSLNGEEPRFQAVEMAGYADIDPASGDLTIDAVGALDPAAVGQERAPGNGMFTFRFVVPDAGSLQQ